jgi:hemoglobin-like flavoprotein
MNPTQIKLVQDSFARVAPISEQAAVLFYDRLFEVAPPVRAMFPDDMTEQRKKLMATLAVVVNGLSNLEAVLPAASALAKRHVSYGAKPEHYPVVGGALLWTLEKGLGDAWTPRSRRSLDRGLRHAVRLHDRGSLRPRSSCRVRIKRIRRERTACDCRQWHGRRPPGR